MDQEHGWYICPRCLTYRVYSPDDSGEKGLCDRCEVTLQDEAERQALQEAELRDRQQIEQAMERRRPVIQEAERRRQEPPAVAPVSTVPKSSVAPKPKPRTRRAGRG